MTSSPLKLAVLLAGAALLAGCASVGPDYPGPPAAAPKAAAAAAFNRAAVAGASPVSPPARWWDSLNDPLLSHFIDQALAQSPTIDAAQARVRGARASLRESRTKLLPTGGANAREISARLPVGALSALTDRTNGGGGVKTVDLYNADFDASWEIDVFGGARRGVEAAAARAAAQQAALEDVQVELAAETAQVYVDLRDAQARLALAREDLAVEARVLDLVRERQAHGVAAAGDVERAETDLYQTQAQIAPLQSRIDQLRDQLAVLTGEEPGALDGALAEARPVPTPPATTLVGDPASLLRRRPDIREAERRLAASNAQIGQNVAQYFPRVQLIGDIGFTATEPGQVFRHSNFSALGGPSLSWGILNFPRIAAEVGEARAGRDEAAAQYRRTVLAALQDAEASLSRYGGQRESLAALALAETSARRAAEATRLRYQAGTAALIDLLDAQRQAIHARQALAQGQAGLTDNFIALQKSLGLGWLA